jgi:hypothetical protein
MWKHWELGNTRFGHVSSGKGDMRINDELQSSLSRRRMSVSLRYAASNVEELNEVSFLVDQTVNSHFRGENRDESN